MIGRPFQLHGRIATSVAYGRRRFPTRADYEHALRDDPNSPGTLECSPAAAAAALRHWHGTGQTGCLFARLLGQRATPEEWPIVVFTDELGGPLGEPIVARLRTTMAVAIRDPQVELISIAFSRCTTVEQLRGLVAELHRHGIVRFFEDRELGEWTRVIGRVPVTHDGIVAWAMAFGPYADWPATRRGPVFELVVRTKRKPEQLFHKLNRDPRVAHLADVDLGYDDEHMGRLFDGTLRTTRDVLGHDPDKLSAAKTTFSFPTEVWDAADGPLLELGRVEPVRESAGAADSLPPDARRP